MSNYAFLAGVPLWAALLGVVLVVSSLGCGAAKPWPPLPTTQHR